jgi:uncharacterized repeat protein (TIGR04076 family)
MFRVKATVVAALGDPENYPCHFNYKIGDEIIYDGAEIRGGSRPASTRCSRPSWVRV